MGIIESVQIICFLPLCKKHKIVAIYNYIVELTF